MSTRGPAGRATRSEYTPAAKGPKSSGYCQASVVLMVPTLWLRCAETCYCHQATIGTGLKTIGGPVRSEVKAQLRYKF